MTYIYLQQIYIYLLIFKADLQAFTWNVQLKQFIYILTLLKHICSNCLIYSLTNHLDGQWIVLCVSYPETFLLKPSNPLSHLFFRDGAQTVKDHLNALS